MLEQHLKDHGLASLDGLGIDLTYHAELPLAIANYNQIRSQPYKFHPIVKLCRGTIIDTNTLKIVGRGPERFFHVNEIEFDWSNYKCYEKVDGSYITAYYYDGWKINTRGSWAEGNICVGGPTWNEVVRRYLPFRLNKDCSYVFELVGPLNRVVRLYPEGLYLLYGWNFADGRELSDEELDDAARDNAVLRPAVYNYSQEELAELINNHPDKTFEGFVLKDKSGRAKLKTLSYLALHRLKNNGHVASLRSFIEFYCQGELEEAYQFEEYHEIFDQYKARLDYLIDEAQFNLDKHAELTGKAFALQVKDLPSSALIFSAKRLNCSIREVLPGKQTYLENLYRS